jgi:hypothetical protein
MSDPNANPTPPPAPEPEKLSLTRAELDALLETERGKARRHSGAEAEAIAKDRERLKALEADAAERARADEARKIEEAQKRGDFEKSRELIIKSAQDEERSKWEPELAKERERAAKFEDRIKTGLRDKIKASAAPWAYNADQVVDLVEGRRVRYNADFEIEILDAAGQQTLVGGKPMTIDQFMDVFKSENPNMVKSNGKPGGAMGGIPPGATPGERGALEAQIKALESRFRQTRDDGLLKEHRELSLRLRKMSVS